MKDKRIVLLAGGAILLALIALALLVNLVSGTAEVRNFAVTNVTDTSATFVWTTDKPAKATAVVSVDDNFSGKDKFYDLRDMEEVEQGVYEVSGEEERYTHFITVKDLSPETTYNFEIMHNGKTAEVGMTEFGTTAILDAMGSPDPVYGQVFDSLGERVDDGIVFFSVSNGVDIGSEYRTAYVTNGTYTLDVHGLKVDNLVDQYKINDTDIQTLEYFVEDGGMVTSAVYSFSPDDDQPVADMTVDGEVNANDIGNKFVSEVSAQSGCDLCGPGRRLPCSAGQCKSCSQCSTEVKPEEDAEPAVKTCGPTTSCSEKVCENTARCQETEKPDEPSEPVKRATAYIGNKDAEEWVEKNPDNTVEVKKKPVDAKEESDEPVKRATAYIGNKEAEEWVEKNPDKTVEITVKTKIAPAPGCSDNTSASADSTDGLGGEEYVNISDDIDDLESAGVPDCSGVTKPFLNSVIDGLFESSGLMSEADINLSTATCQTGDSECNGLEPGQAYNEELPASGLPGIGNPGKKCVLKSGTTNECKLESGVPEVVIFGNPDEFDPDADCWPIVGTSDQCRNKNIGHRIGANDSTDLADGVIQYCVGDGLHKCVNRSDYEPPRGLDIGVQTDCSPLEEVNDNACKGKNDGDPVGPHDGNFYVCDHKGSGVCYYKIGKDPALAEEVETTDTTGGGWCQTEQQGYLGQGCCEAPEGETGYKCRGGLVCDSNSGSCVEKVAETGTGLSGCPAPTNGSCSGAGCVYYACTDAGADQISKCAPTRTSTIDVCGAPSTGDIGFCGGAGQGCCGDPNNTDPNLRKEYKCNDGVQMTNDEFGNCNCGASTGSDNSEGGLLSKLFSLVSAQDDENIENTSVNTVEAGLYEVVDENNVSKTYEVEADGPVRYYYDLNGNGTRDADEDYLSDEVAGRYQFNINKVAELTSYRFTEGWNALSFPMIMSGDNTSNVVNASDLIKVLNEQGANVTHVTTFRDGQPLIFSLRVDNNGDEIIFGPDYKILPGEGYFVKNYKSTNANLTGNKVQGALDIMINNGWNLVGIYNEAKPNYGAFEVMRQMNTQSLSVDVMSEWESGQYTNVVINEGTEFGNDYKVYQNGGYWVRSDVAAPGGKYTPE